MGADPACVLKAMWGAYAASDNGLQPAVSLGIKFAGLAYEIWPVIFERGRKVQSTMCMHSFLPPSGKSQSGIEVDIRMKAQHVVSGFFDWFVLNVWVFQCSGLLGCRFASLPARCLKREYLQVSLMQALKWDS